MHAVIIGRCQIHGDKTPLLHGFAKFIIGEQLPDFIRFAFGLQDLVFIDLPQLRYHAICRTDQRIWIIINLARAIFERAGVDCAVRDIPGSAYPTPARRPANSRLDCSRIARDFGIARPDWRADLDRVLNQLGYPT